MSFVTYCHFFFLKEHTSHFPALCEHHTHMGCKHNQRPTIDFCCQIVLLRQSWGGVIYFTASFMCLCMQTSVFTFLKVGKRPAFPKRRVFWHQPLKVLQLLIWLCPAAAHNLPSQSSLKMLELPEKDLLEVQPRRSRSSNPRSQEITVNCRITPFTMKQIH